MRYSALLPIAGTVATLCMAMLDSAPASNEYRARYEQCLADLEQRLGSLEGTIRQENVSTPEGRRAATASIHEARTALKAFDLWARYLDPINHRRINGPLPVEWETEVFEKYEKPYRREGAGLTLAELYLDEPGFRQDSLLRLVNAAITALGSYRADSVTMHLSSPDHFLFCNRLMLLNLAAIYTTGFECPDTARVIPELRDMIKELRASTDAFNSSFPYAALPPDYRERLTGMIAFVDAQPDAYSAFDHFTFLRDHVGPLFRMNQEHIRRTGARSRSWMDYSLNNNANVLFSKDLYIGQDAKGVYRHVDDTATLAQVRQLGRTLFFDPLLSGNRQRSCASCHQPGMCFTDTSRATSIAFDHHGALARNAPSLVNADLNHLLMQDGKHIGLQAQAKDVLTNPIELGANADTVLMYVMSCADYRKGFTALLKHTPAQREVTLDHLLSAVTVYYASFSGYRSTFDDVMNGNGAVDEDVRAGFNLFMSKAQCATCHFVPHFNGVKPPYIGSEFEVIGVPEDNLFAMLSDDIGRSAVNPAPETRHAFRTGGLRNIARSAPYMHNGVFRTLREVIDLYDAGGGSGHGLDVPNQTLSSDSLHLTDPDKSRLEAFMRSLSEDLPAETIPSSLPPSKRKELNARKPGGTY
jgi:cytochrome c peroxidase